MSAPVPAVSSVEPGASRVPVDTVRAYLESDYGVASEPPLVLRIDRPSAALRELHAAYGVTSSAFLTACNPLGRIHVDEENRRQQARLAKALRRLGFPALDGMGRHPTNGWPGEASFLVLGPGRDIALDLGRRYGQNAIVWCGVDAVPRLLLLR